MADDLERAILCMYSEDVPDNVRAEAIQFCQQVLKSEDGWKYCAQKLTAKCQEAAVEIYCFSAIEEIILHSYERLSSQEKSDIRNLLLQWLAESHHRNPGGPKVAIRNVFAKTLVCVFRSEYPEQWPTFFSDVFGVMQSAGSTEGDAGNSHFIQNLMKDYFLRILLAIDELVVLMTVTGTEHQRYHNQLIKDYMKKDCLNDIVGFWWQILVEGQSSELVCLVLENISKYVDWIDINLIVNDRFLGFIYKVLPDPTYRRKCCNCIAQIVSKKMKPEEKMELLNYLKLTDIFSLATSDDLDACEDVGNVVNLVGMEALKVVKGDKQSNEAPNGNLQAHAYQLCVDIIPYVLSILAHDYDEISETCAGFITDYVSLLKSFKNRSLTPKETQIVGDLIQIISRKMEYEEDFDFNSPRADEEEAEFLAYRRNLTRLFKGCTYLAPQKSCDFVRQLVMSVVNDLQSKSFAAVEAALTMFYLLPEHLSAMEKPPKLDEYFQQLVVGIITSDVARYEHRVVRMAYMDVVQRFAKNLPSDSDIIFNTVQPFLDDRGVRSFSPTIRSRSAYLFLRVCSTLRERLRPFVQEIVQSLGPLLSIDAGSGDDRALENQDKCHLYEALSVLFSTLPPEEVYEVSGMVLYPILQQVEQCLSVDSKQIAASNVHKKHFEEVVSLLGHFMKGFSVIHEKCIPLFENAIKAVISLLGHIPSTEMHSHVLQVLHCAVESLKERIFPLLPAALNELFVNSDSDETFSRNLTFLNQLSVRFKDQIAPILKVLFGIIVDRIFQRLGTDVSPGSEEERELQDVQCQFCMFIQQLFQNNLGMIVLQDERFLSIAQFHLIVMKTTTDKTTRSTKLATVSFQAMVLHCQGNAEMMQFLLTQLSPAVYECLFSSSWDCDTPVGMMVLSELTKLQFILVKALEKDFVSFVQDVVLQNVAMPDAYKHSFLQHLASGDVKSFRDFLLTLLREMKK